MIILQQSVAIQFRSFFLTYFVLQSALYYKVRQSNFIIMADRLLLQRASGKKKVSQTLLQSASGITKRDIHNTCHKVQLHKKLMNTFTENFKT